jgi:hypothetical protein
MIFKMVEYEELIRKNKLASISEYRKQGWLKDCRRTASFINELSIHELQYKCQQKESMLSKPSSFFVSSIAL